MSETLKRFLGVAMPAPAPQRELVVVPPAPPMLAELAASIRKAHAEVTEAVEHGAAAAIRAGKLLDLVKKSVSHGSWETYVTEVCGLNPRTAQHYCRLAKHEAKLAQWAEEKAQGLAALSQTEALKMLGSLGRKRRR